ncbi:MAG: flagellar hook-basal body complex protein, partial [Spirochaetales bacterium]
FQNETFAANPDRLVSMEENEWENTEFLDKLKIVEFHRDRYLKKQGSSLWVDTEESGKASLFQAAQGPKIRQGFIEASNVNPVREMVDMIEVNRAYEANQKVIQTDDSLASRLVNDAVKV